MPLPLVLLLVPLLLLLILVLGVLIACSVWQLSCVLDDWEITIWFLAGARGFLLLHSVHTSSEAHPAFSPMGTRCSFHGIKWLWHEADHSFLSNAKIKNACYHTSILPYIIMAWGLIKHRDNFMIKSLILLCCINFIILTIRTPYCLVPKLFIIQILICSQFREVFFTFSYAFRSAVRLQLGTCIVKYVC
jgi:hypothetical protein